MENTFEVYILQTNEGYFVSRHPEGTFTDNYVHAMEYKEIDNAIKHAENMNNFYKNNNYSTRVRVLCKIVNVNFECITEFPKY